MNHSAWQAVPSILRYAFQLIVMLLVLDSWGATAAQWALSSAHDLDAAVTNQKHHQCQEEPSKEQTHCDSSDDTIGQATGEVIHAGWSSGAGLLHRASSRGRASGCGHGRRRGGKGGTGVVECHHDIAAVGVRSPRSAGDHLQGYHDAIAHVHLEREGIGCGFEKLSSLLGSDHCVVLTHLGQLRQVSQVDSDHHMISSICRQLKFIKDKNSSGTQNFPDTLETPNSLDTLGTQNSLETPNSLLLTFPY